MGKSIAVIALLAAAVGGVIGVDANGVLGAGITYKAGLPTGLPGANLRQRAIVVASATGCIEIK